MVGFDTCCGWLTYLVLVSFIRALVSHCVSVGHYGERGIMELPVETISAERLKFQLMSTTELTFFPLLIGLIIV